MVEKKKKTRRKERKVTKDDFMKALRGLRGKATTPQMVKKLGLFWDTKVRYIGRSLQKKGEISMKRVGRPFVYEIKGATPQEQPATEPIEQKV